MIYTFYSYKGGVGRSMALANVAELFRADGLDVLMIDWDLEAPGLERYFPMDHNVVLQQLGVVDMIVEYKRIMATPGAVTGSNPPRLDLPDAESYVLEIQPGNDQGLGRLLLMPAGRRFGDAFNSYAVLARTFDWQDFYKNWEGELFLEWFRRQVRELANVVLIDSRTGVTEMGGICTYQLADMVVMCCAPNTQNLDGTYRMAVNLKDPEVVALRGGRPLDVLVVPARIEDRAETELLAAFRKDFNEYFGRKRFPDELSLAASAEEMWQLKIPHVPFYAFREAVVVRDAHGVGHEDMQRAFERIKAQLAKSAPQGSSIKMRHAEATVPTAEAPVVWNVPRAAYQFTGRQKALHDLKLSFADGQKPATVTAVTGLGGIGKTALAIEYASQRREDYDVVWWVRANDAQTLAADYAHLADELGLPERDMPDQQAVVQAVRRWLSRHQRWLLIFDNVQGPEVLNLVPSGGGGHVLITSRYLGWRREAHPLQLDVLRRKEAVEFLLERTGESDHEAAEALAEVLGDLPLALEQAAAYIVEGGITLANYLEMFQRRSAELLQRGAAGSFDQTVDTSWNLSFERLKQESSLGADLLRLCAFLAPDDIPRTLFTQGASELPTSMAAAAADPITFSDAISALRRYALVLVEEDHLSVHRLVQAVVRSRQVDGGQQRWAGAAVRMVHASFPKDSNEVGTWPTCARLLPHALVTTKHAQDLAVEAGATSLLMDKSATYLHARGEFAAARELFDSALRAAHVAFGSEAAATAAVRDHLGSVLRDLGDFAAAERQYRSALTIAEVTEGHDSPQVASILNHLGGAMCDLGELAGAKAALERALAIASDQDWPTVETIRAVTLSNLGRVLSVQGKLTEANAAFERALEITKATYGPGHPETAAALSNLGRVRSDLGDPLGAKEDFEQALGIVEAVYGRQHPNVSAVLDDLGQAIYRLGKPSEARKIHEQALAIDEEFYGPEHPHVATDLKNLGNVLRNLGLLAEARANLERALAITEAAYGPEHPEVADSLNDLGPVLQELGDLDAAVAIFERALAITEAAYGPEHPEVAAVLNNLGQVRRQVGDLDAAKACFERALAIAERIYGQNHPAVGTALNNVGRIKQELGDLDGAMASFERALSIVVTAYGPDHPDVAEKLNNLGLLRADRGDWAAAKSDLERALAISEATYGPQHPTVAFTLYNLASVVTNLRQLADARDYLKRAIAIIDATYGSRHPLANQVRQALERVESSLREEADAPGSRPRPPDLGRQLALELKMHSYGDEDPEELARSTSHLRHELLSLDVEAVDLPRVEAAPAGAKAVGALSFDTLLVRLSRSSDALGAVLNAVRSWLGRNRQRSIRIEIDGDAFEVQGMSLSDQHQLINAFVARHTDR